MKRNKKEKIDGHVTPTMQKLKKKQLLNKYAGRIRIQEGPTAESRRRVRSENDKTNGVEIFQIFKGPLSNTTPRDGN